MRRILGPEWEFGLEFGGDHAQLSLCESEIKKIYWKGHSTQESQGKWRHLPFSLCLYLLRITKMLLYNGLIPPKTVK